MRWNCGACKKRDAVAAALLAALGVAGGAAGSPWDDPPTTVFPPDGAGGDEFGCTVSISGDTAVAGAWSHDHLGPDAGAAFVYRRIGDSWQQERELLASDAAAYDAFGFAVAVDGDVAVVGAFNEGNQGQYVPGPGAAYVFRRSGGSWVQEQKLVGDGVPGDAYGWSVAVSGDVIVVGANGADGYAGAAWVYRHNGQNWSLETRISRPQGAANFFATSVSVDGDFAVISNSLNTANGQDSGAAYVFRRQGSNWVQDATLLASDGQPGDAFAYSVAISGNVIVAGAPFEDDAGLQAGALYVFRHDGQSWNEEAKLTAADGTNGDNLGWSVGASGDLVLAGAPGRDDPDLMLPDFGAAYPYRYGSGSWSPEGILLDPNGWYWDNFGWAVAASGDSALAGAYLADTSGPNSGKAVIFEAAASSGDCPGDLNGDGVVGVTDFLDVLAAWEGSGSADINGDGTVGIEDLLELLMLWGDCP